MHSEVLFNYLSCERSLELGWTFRVSISPSLCFYFVILRASIFKFVLWYQCSSHILGFQDGRI